MTNKLDEIKKLKSLLDEGVLTKEEFQNEKEKLLKRKTQPIETKEPTKEQKKKAGCIVTIITIIILAIPLTLFVKHMNKITADVDVYFDPLEYTVEENGTTRTLTEEEVIQKLGEPTSSEEWKYKKANGKYLMLKTLTYKKDDNSYREYLINLAPDGSRNLIRINLYETIPYENKYTILKMFNLYEYKNSEINDINTSYRAKNVGIYDFWIQSMTKDSITFVKFTFVKGMFD